jgi:hypothetical protein
MEDLLRTLVNAPTNAVLVLAGLAFLAVAVFGRVTDRLDPGPKGRTASGLLGVGLLAIGLLLPSDDNHRSAPTAANSTPPVPATSPQTSSTSGAGVTGTRAEPVPASNVSSAPPRGDYPIVLAAGQVVKREDKTYTILKMQLEGGETNDLALEVTARMANESPYPANFWNNNFRLVVDDVPNAPVGSLNELVDGHAAKEGVVKFAVRSDAKTAILQIDRFGSDAPGIAIALPHK